MMLEPGFQAAAWAGSAAAQTGPASEKEQWKEPRSCLSFPTAANSNLSLGLLHPMQAPPGQRPHPKVATVHTEEPQPCSLLYLSSSSRAGRLRALADSHVDLQATGASVLQTPDVPQHTGLGLFPPAAR